MRKIKKIYKEKKVKFASIIIAFVLVASSVIYALASQKVTMAVTQVPNIDVVLTKAKTNVDLTNFENDLLNNLASKGISKDKVKITAVEAESEVTTESFEWQKDTMSPSIGSINITGGGKDVVMKGNSRLAGKNAIYIMPTGNQEQEFNFGYNIDFGDSFNAAGMLLRVEKTGNTLNGYMLSFNNSAWNSAAGGSNGAIWEFTFPIGSNSSNFTKTLKKKLTINKSGNLNVKVTDKEIIVNGGGLSAPETYELEKTFGSGYGFFSDHYSHGCDSIGSFTLSGIKLTTVTVKDFNEVLRAPDWRDGACKVLVNVSDVTNDQFEGTDAQLTEIISRLMNDNIHYIGWGTDTNKAEMDNTIATNDNKGLFIDNSDYSAAIEKTATYIKDSLAGISETKSVISNEPVTVKINPESEATNTADTNYPNGKWKVEHDYDYYENNEGQYDKSGVYTEDVITSFPKPGSYKVYYEDELVTEIFAHRRPVASFNLEKNGSSVTLTSTSYDLDKQSQQNGIQKEEWTYRKAGTTKWQSGKLTTLDADSTYIVKLKVTDFQGATNETTKYVTSENVVLNPVAQYKITNKTISLYKQLEVIDSSYDPAGLDLTSWVWTVKKGNTTVYTGATPLTNYKADNLGAGTYTMGLVVKNSENKVSEEFSQTFTITADVTAPEFIASITESTVVNSTIDVGLNFTDAESGVKSYKYAITESRTDEPTSWTTIDCTEANAASFYSEVRISGIGKWYLHIKATDNDGNESTDRVLGVYDIQKGYTVEIQAVDSNTGVGLEGAKFQIAGEYQNGKAITMDSTVKTTSANGKIVLTDVPLIGLSTLKIVNTTELAGYQKNDIKIVTTDTTTDNIVVNSNLTSSDITATPSSDGQTLSVKVPLSKKKFNLKITAVDASNTNIKLTGAEFVLKYKGKEVGRGKTVDGELTINSPIGIATGVADDFILQQVSAPAGYNATSNTTLSVSFAGDGSFISLKQPLFGGNSQVSIPNKNNPEIVVKNTRSASGTFAVSTKVVDESNTLVPIQGSKYKLKIETDTGLSYVTESATSDSSGKLQFTNLFGLGIVKLTFIHEAAPEGYGITSTDRYITIENNNGTITYNQSSISGVFEKVENGTIYTTLTNAKKTSTNSIKIKVHQRNNDEVGIQGINFEIYKLIGNTKIGSGTTDADGTLTLDNIKSDGTGDIVYKIVPVNQSNTDINPSILISITFDSNGYAIGAKQISSIETVKVEFGNEDSPNLYRRVSTIKIGTTVEEPVGDTQITITKKEAITNASIIGSSYRIRMKYDGKVFTNSYTTNQDGQFTFTIPETDEVILEILEVKSADGYTLDTRTKKMKLAKNSAGKLVPITSSFVNIESGNVTVDPNNNININILEEGTSLKYPKIKFQIKKTDGTGSLELGGTYFRLTNKNTGEFQNIVTDSNGYIETNMMTITQARDYTFELEETKAVAGYELPDQPFVIRVNFEESGNIVKYVGEQYLTGEELLGEKNSSYDQLNNEVTISLNVKNEEAEAVDPEISVYGIDVEKVDKDGNPVTGSQYDIEVRPFGMSSQKLTDKEITSNIEVPIVELTEDITTVLLREKQEALGYGKDDQIKVITVYKDASGALAYNQDSSSQDLKITIEDRVMADGTTRQILKITITAKEPEEVKPTDPTKPTVPTDPTNPTNPTVDSLGLLKIQNTDSSGNVISTAYKVDDLTYEIKVKNTYLDTTVVAETIDSTSKITIDTESEQVGKATKLVDLSQETTYVTIKVENAAGTQDKTYTLNLVKSTEDTGSISEDLLIKEVKAAEGTETKQGTQTSNTTYEIGISETATEVNLTVVTKDANAKVSISGEDPTVNTQTTKIVIVNDETNVNVVIESPDGTKTQSYTITIKKVYEEDDSIPAENDPNATFKLRLFNKNNGEIWTRTYRQLYDHDWSHYWCAYYYTEQYEFQAEQRLPVFFKSEGIYGSHINWGSKGGYYLLNGFSKMKVEARLIQNDGTVSSDIYETRELRQNTSNNINDVYGTHTANFKKNYNNKQVEFTVIQDIPLYNHKKFETMKISVKFDNNGNIISGELKTAATELRDIAIAGISPAGTGVVNNIAYPNTRTPYINQWWGWINSDYYDEIEDYDSRGTNILNVGILNTTIDNKFNITLNLEDIDTNDKLNGAASIIVTEKDTSNDWKLLETIPANIVDGVAKVNLSKTYANRHLRFTITQTSSGTLKGNTYTNPSNTSIEVELQLDDNGNIASLKEISTPSAKLEDSPTGGNSIEYTIYNEKDYNFSIDITKLDENGNPLPGVRLKTETRLITDADLSTGPVIDTYGSKLTDENGYAKLKVVLPTTGANKYYGRTIDIIIREYYVPDNYLAYKDIKVRVMFTSQGKIAVAPELISEPEAGMVSLSNQYTTNSISLSIKNKQLTEHPSIEINNINAVDDKVLIGDTQYKVTSWDQVEYENDHITYKEQAYSDISDATNGVSTTYMSKSHALRTIIYTLEEVKTSESYIANKDIIIKVVYDEEGKIVSRPEILSTQTILGDDVVSIEGNPIGHTMLALKVRHELKPKFTINVTKYDTKNHDIVVDKEFIGTSQVKQADGTYGAVEENITSIQDDNDRIKIGFKTEHKRETVLYTVYEKTGNTDTRRGQVEVEFDAYGNVANATIVDIDLDSSGNVINYAQVTTLSGHNYMEGTQLNTNSNYIGVRIKTEEFRIKVVLKSTDPSTTHSLAGAKFDIQNEYEEICNTTKGTDTTGKVIEIVGEEYRGETITYTIKQITAPEDYDLVDDITFDVIFGDDGSILNLSPIMVQDKYAVTTTVEDENGNNMEIEIFTKPSDREKVTITAKDEDNSAKNIDFAQYDIKAVVVSPNISPYTLNLTDGTGTTDLGPDKRFFGKTIAYSINQTNISSNYMLCDQEIKVTVQYDVDGTIKDMYLQNPTDGSVKITDPVSGQSSTSMLNNLSGSYTFQIDMVNKRKTIMQVEDQSIENSNEKIANSTFKIIEQGKSNLYSDTNPTGSDGTVNMYVGPYYRAEAGQTIEKTYEISNITPGFGFNKIDNATFTLKYDENGKVIDGTVSTVAQKYLEIEIIPDTSSLYGTVDVRIIVKSTPTLTFGIEAINKTTSASITGMKYEIRQSAPTAGTAKTVITNNGYIAHADMGKSLAGQMVTYEIVEKQVATGYKYKNKDNVIARFEVVFDTDGYITNNINGQKINITYGNEYFELNQSVDKTQHYDLDFKVNYEESEEFTIKIKNKDALNNSNYITSDFSAMLGSSNASGTTDASGELTLTLGKRAANEKGTLTISQSNVQGSYAAINTIALRLEFDENGKINTNGISPVSGNYATINVSYRILQPAGTPTYIIEIEVYNNPVTTFKIENVDQGDETVKLQSTFNLTGTTGIATPITLTTDANDGMASTTLDSVPKKSRVTYTITQDNNSVPSGYGKILDIRFTVYYNEDGLIASQGDISNLGNGTSTADGTTVEFIREDSYTIKIKIKSKRQFGVYIETVDAFDTSIKLGAQVYIREDQNRKNATLTTQAGVGTANAILGTNIANSGLTYTVRLINSPTAPSGSTQTYYRDGTEEVNIRVTFDANGNVNTISYGSSDPNGNTQYVRPNCIIETDRVNGAAVKITIKYIPNLTVTVTRKDAASGNGLYGKRIELSSSNMKNSPRAGTTNSTGKTSPFDGGRIAADDGTEVEYRISETNSAVDYNYEALPRDMKVWVTYDSKGNIKTTRTNYSDIITMSGIGTRALDVEITSYREAKIMLFNTDYYLNTNRISGKYVITSSKGERSNEIVTPESSTSGSTVTGTPIRLGKIYAGESVVYTIHNTSAKNGYEIVDDMQFTVDYASDGTISIDPTKFSDADKLSLMQINQTVNQNTAHVNLEVKSKPNLIVKIHVTDKTYTNQAIEKIGFEISDASGYVNKVETLTDANGDVTIPIKTAQSNATVHYTITQTATNGGYETIAPLTLVVKYNAAGTIDEKGTYIVNSKIAEVVQGYSEPLYASSKMRGIKINVKLETKLGIGILKVDGDTGNPLQGVTFKITEEELVGGTASNSWNSNTDINGETTTYTRNIGGSVQKIRYTITETDPPEGYRPIKDIIFDVTFSSDKRVQSISVVQAPDGVSINPSNAIGSSTYDLKKMAESKEFVHIQVTVKNDNKVKFKIVNLDKGLADLGTEVGVQDSEFNATVSQDGTVIGTFDTANSNQLVTNVDGEASVSVSGNGKLTFYFTQTVTGTGYEENQANTGFITVNKSSSEYKITYQDSTDNIRYKIDEQTGEVIVYVFNENTFKLNINNVDIDDTTLLAVGAEQKIKAYYGELTDSVQTILSQTTNVVEYNNNYAYQNQTGNLSEKLGNTYNFINKKVVFEIDTVGAPNGYTAIGKVYAVAEFDKFGKLVKLENADSERIVSTKVENSYEGSIYIGFGNLNKYSVKIIKESPNGARIDGTEFSIETFVNDAQTDLGFGQNPITKTTGPSQMVDASGNPVENGIIEQRGIEATGNIKIKLDELQAAPGFENNLGTAEITFTCTTDTTDPLEPRPNITNASSNNSMVTVTANNKTREIEIKVLNESRIGVELEKVDDNGDPLKGVEFTATTQIEGDPTSINMLEPVKTGDDGKLQISLPANYVNTVLLITLQETKPEGYKQAAAIQLRICTDKDGKIITNNVNIGAGEYKNDGNGGATITGTSSSLVGIKVVNIMEEGYRPIQLKVVKEDSVDKTKVLSNAQFQVKITPDVGTPKYCIDTTNSNGIIEISNIVGEGNIKVELQEIVAPTGYTLGSTDGYFTFTINKAERGITKVSSSLGQRDDKSDRIEIDSSNRIVTAYVPNELDQIGIDIHKVDASNGMSIANATFKLEDPTTSYSELVTTDANGIADFHLDKRTSSGTVTYTLTEEGTPQGYKPNVGTMTIEVEYNNEGNIVDVTESGEKILLTEQKDKYIQLEVSNEAEVLNIPLYSVQIVNTDKSDNSIVIPNSAFSVLINQETGSEQISQNIVMDSDGQNTIANINGAGKISIDIEEIVPGDGYKKNVNNRKVTLARNTQTGKFTILSNVNAYPVYDEANNKITIYVSSEKQTGIYSLVINKVDEEGNRITADAAEFDVTVNGETQKATVDKNGKAILNKLKIPDGTDFDISITETKKLNGYAQEINSQVLNATILTVYEEKVLNDVTIKSGNAIAIINKSESTIEVNFTNQSEDTETLYLTSDVYTVTDDYVERVPAWTTIADYLTNMKSNGTMTIYDKAGNEITDTTKLVGTGMIIKATKDDQEITKTIIVTGDVTGNGQIKLLDVSKVNQHFVGQSPLDGIYLKAADMSGDGRISILDVSKINQAFVNH